MYFVCIVFSPKMGLISIIFRVFFSSTKSFLWTCYTWDKGSPLFLPWIIYCFRREEREEEERGRDKRTREEAGERERERKPIIINSEISHTSPCHKSLVHSAKHVSKTRSITFLELKHKKNRIHSTYPQATARKRDTKKNVFFHFQTQQCTEWWKMASELVIHTRDVTEAPLCKQRWNCVLGGPELSFWIVVEI